MAPKWEKATGGWGKLCNEAFNNLLSSENQDGKMKADDVGGTYSTYGEKGFGLKIPLEWILNKSVTILTGFK
jgi:hypothetical protein